MPIRLVHWRTLTVGVSCLLHLGLIAVVLIAEQALSAHVSRPPVLPVELVTAVDPPQPEPPPRVVPKPEPPPRVVERPKPVPPRPISLPKPIETPLPAVTQASAPVPPPTPLRPPEPARVPDPPAPTASTVSPAPTPPATAVSSATSPDREPGPAARPSGSRAEPSTASADGIPLGRPPGSSGSGQGGPVSVASASGRATGATGAITRYARPQGGYQVRPGYPATARRLGIQGTTMLRVHVLVDGQVGDVVVQESAGHPDLDQAAADAVRRWKFEPGRRGEEAVAMWVLLPVEFRLK